MDDCGSRNAESFEEMKVSNFKWILKDDCTGLPSLKKASKYQVIHNIVLSLLFMVFGVGLGSAASYFGIPFLVVETLLLVYSHILLSSVRDNHGVRVFQIIKILTLTLLSLQLITKLIIFVGRVTLLADPVQARGWIVYLVDLLDLALTSLAIFIIHRAEPQIVSLLI